jgi:hypothetical protein
MPSLPLRCIEATGFGQSTRRVRRVHPTDAAPDGLDGMLAERAIIIVEGRRR